MHGLLQSVRHRVCVFSSVLPTSTFLHCEACAKEIRPASNSWTSLKRFFFFFSARKNRWCWILIQICIWNWKLKSISISHALTPTIAEKINVSSGQIRVGGSFALLFFGESLNVADFCSLFTTKLCFCVWPCQLLSEHHCHLSMPLMLHFLTFCLGPVIGLLLLLPGDLCSWGWWHRQMPVTGALAKHRA